MNNRTKDVMLTNEELAEEIKQHWNIMTKDDHDFTPLFLAAKELKNFFSRCEQTLGLLAEKPGHKVKITFSDHTETVYNNLDEAHQAMINKWEWSSEHPNPRHPVNIMTLT